MIMDISIKIENWILFHPLKFTVMKLDDSKKLISSQFLSMWSPFSVYPVSVTNDYFVEILPTVPRAKGAVSCSLSA